MLKLAKGEVRLGICESLNCLWIKFPKSFKDEK